MRHVPLVGTTSPDASCSPAAPSFEYIERSQARSAMWRLVGSVSGACLGCHAPER